MSKLPKKPVYNRHTLGHHAAAHKQREALINAHFERIERKMARQEYNWNYIYIPLIQAVAIICVVGYLSKIAGMW